MGVTNCSARRDCLFRRSRRLTVPVSRCRVRGTNSEKPGRSQARASEKSATIDGVRLRVHGVSVADSTRFVTSPAGASPTPESGERVTAAVTVDCDASAIPEDILPSFARRIVNGGSLFYGLEIAPALRQNDLRPSRAMGMAPPSTPAGVDVPSGGQEPEGSCPPVQFLGAARARPEAVSLRAPIEWRALDVIGCGPHGPGPEVRLDP